jgi:hypothetical protein
VFLYIVFQCSSVFVNICKYSFCVCCEHLVYCVSFFCVNFCKIFILFYFVCSLRSNVLIYVRMYSRPAFDFTVVSSTAAHPAHAHTQAHLRSNLPCKFERRARCATCARHECGRTQFCAFERTRAGPFQDLFLGHFFPFSPFSPIGRTSSPPLCLRSPPQIAP